MEYAHVYFPLVNTIFNVVKLKTSHMNSKKINVHQCTSVIREESTSDDVNVSELLFCLHSALVTGGINGHGAVPERNEQPNETSNIYR